MASEDVRSLSRQAGRVGREGGGVEGVQRPCDVASWYLANERLPADIPRRYNESAGCGRSSRLVNMGAKSMSAAGIYPLGLQRR